MSTFMVTVIVRGSLESPARLKAGLRSPNNAGQCLPAMLAAGRLGGRVRAPQHTRRHAATGLSRTKWD